MPKQFIRLFATLALATQSFAFTQEQPSITASVIITKPSAKLAGQKYKQVFLMPVNLSEKQKQQFLKIRTLDLKNVGTENGLPAKFIQPMDVPVLDQGKHGTCVTFAITAAIDALLHKGDYVSQLCSLELGNYLEQDGYLPSGWMGSTGPWVLHQMQQYGYISKEDQHAKSCSGMIHYPVNDQNNIGSPMTLDDYKQMSNNLANNTEHNYFYWESVLTMFDRLQWQKPAQASEKLLSKIKHLLTINLNTQTADSLEGKVTIGVLLPLAIRDGDKWVQICSAGACGSYHAANDTWALTNTIKNNTNIRLGGHEMVIIGYDDNAIVIDNEGDKHQGILYLRNSWGDEVGDQGNYYMTYDFFKTFVDGIESILYAHLDAKNKTSA